MINFKALEQEIRDSGIPLILENILGYILEVKNISDVDVLTQIDDLKDMLENLLGGVIKVIIGVSEFLDKNQVKSIQAEAETQKAKIEKLDRMNLLNKFQNN